ncbi:hypothetical protein ACQP25_16940 [Microtetraspora malaysiensis]|uniref:hypothetical protein n=1 Tax=Microtetraspora malaysiensis TaxID=161358 RepID=UPI003D8D95B4
MTPPTTAIPTDEEVSDFLAAIKSDTHRHPYEEAPAPRRRIPWRSGRLDPLTESEYRREQADYDGGGA